MKSMCRIVITSLLLVLPCMYSSCEPWCTSPCSSLNGQVSAECGTCTSAYECRPGAAGFVEAITPATADALPSHGPTPGIEPDTSVSVKSDGGVELGHCPKVLNVDRSKFVSDFCHNISERPNSGVIVMRGALNAEELRALRDATGAHAIPYPTRFMCGQSDDEIWTPEECNLSARWLVSRLPRFADISRPLDLWRGTFPRLSALS